MPRAEGFATGSKEACWQVPRSTGLTQRNDSRNADRAPRFLPGGPDTSTPDVKIIASGVWIRRDVPGEPRAVG